MKKESRNGHRSSEKCGMVWLGLLLVRAARRRAGRTVVLVLLGERKELGLLLVRAAVGRAGRTVGVMFWSCDSGREEARGEKGDAGLELGVRRWG